MFAILSSAVGLAAGWFARVVLIKALFFGVLLAITTELTSYMIGKLAGGPVDGLSSSIAAMPSGVLWAMHYFRLDVGLPLILSAHVTAFAIRRLPVVG